MARAVISEQLTAADALRDLLGREERLLGTVGTPGGNAFDLLDVRDQIAEGLPAVEESGIDLRPELGRLETIDGQIHSKAGIIVRQVRAKGGFEAARAERNPPSDRWWWFLDQELADKRRSSLIRLTISAAVALAVVALILVGLNSLGPKDPKVRASLAARQQAENYTARGEWDKAIVEYQKAVDVDPNDAESRIWIGVLSEKLGKLADAEAQYAAAQKLYDRPTFLTARGNNYVMIGEAEKAKADAEEAVRLAPDNGMAYYVLGGALETLGDTGGAADALEKAASLSQDKNPNLYVLARVRLGYLLQGAGARSTSTPTTTPGK